MSSLSSANIIVAWAIASGAALLVFLHANKRGSKHATAWGISVFLFLAIALPVYAIHTWRSKPPGPQRRY
jgi:hypothetical protein